MWTRNDDSAETGFLRFTRAYNGSYYALDALSGRRVSKRVLASLEHGLVEERLRVLGSDDDCSRQDAETRADMALLAVGILTLNRSGELAAAAGFLNTVSHWQLEQARSLIHLTIDELCQEVLWRTDSLPSEMVVEVFERSLRGRPGEPALLPVIITDYWNAGLFASNRVTAARLLECRANIGGWQEKRTDRDPRVMMSYLRTLEIRLREQRCAKDFRHLLHRIEEAITLWKQGYSLGEKFFCCDTQVDGALRSSLRVLIQHVFESQRDPDFPWGNAMLEKAAGTVWHYGEDSSS